MVILAPWIWIGSACLCIWLSRARGRRWPIWLLLGILFGPFTLLVLASIQRSESATSDKWTNTNQGHLLIVLLAIGLIVLYFVSVLPATNPSADESITGNQSQTHTPSSTSTPVPRAEQVLASTSAASPAPASPTQATTPETPNPILTQPSTPTPIPIPRPTPTPVPTRAPDPTQTPPSDLTPTPASTPTPVLTAALTPSATVTPTPAATATPTPAPIDLGRNRSTPYPLGSVASMRDWSLEILRVIRGEEALRRIQDVHLFGAQPSENREYILIELAATYTGSGQADISKSNFALTGSSGILWAPYITTPDTEIEATLLRGGTTLGWIAFEIDQNETDLILLVNTGSFLLSLSETVRLYAYGLVGILDDYYGAIDTAYYVALELGAKVDSVVDELPVANNLGKISENPVPAGAKARTDYFEIEIVEVIRGNDAWSMLKAASQFNDPPDPGMEYVLVLVRVRSIVTNISSIADDAFRTVGERRVVWDTPSVREPKPALGAVLYPGAVHEGWVALQAAVDEQDMLVVFEHTVGFGDIDRRYLETP